MYALTLDRPWPGCFLDPFFGKRLENRTWRPPDTMGVGWRIALHAGAKLDREAEERIYRVARRYPRRGKRGIFAVARLATVYSTVEAVPAEQRRWWLGPYAWHLDDLVALPEPIEARGGRRLWTLPRPVEERVLRQLGEEPR